MITLVACTDINNGIGNAKGELLFKLPKDLDHFKSVTSGKIVVMGRKTWDSLPKKPLPKRKNYVLTRDESFNPMGAKVVHSVEEVLELSKTRDVYVIGGGEIYSLFMEHADAMILTHVHALEMSARVFFPDIDVRDWTIDPNTQKHEADDQHAHSFTFATYKRNK